MSDAMHLSLAEVATVHYSSGDMENEWWCGVKAMLDDHYDSVIQCLEKEAPTSSIESLPAPTEGVGTLKKSKGVAELALVRVCQLLVAE